MILAIFWWFSCFWHDVTYDVTVASYKVCLYLFWYQWTREGHSYPLVPHTWYFVNRFPKSWGGGGIRPPRLWDGSKKPGSFRVKRPLGKLHNQNIKKKNTSKSTTSTITSEEKKIASSLDLADRIDSITEKAPFMTLKDHKPNFNNRPTWRLMNPAKSNICIISKNILEQINREVVATIQLNQWKKTSAVTDTSLTNLNVCSYTGRFSLHQVHGSQCTKVYYTKYSWRILADECMVSEVLRVVPCCQVLL